MNEYAFKFSPSLIDAFQSYLDSEALYEKFFGFSEEPSLTYAEYEQQKFQELIDKINRVPFDSEAADKGSALNEIVDCIVMGVKSTRDDIKVKSVRSYDKLVEQNMYDDGFPSSVIEYMQKVNQPCIVAVKGSRTFLFDIDFCKELAEYFQGSLCQLYVEAPIETKYGKVLLYGYPDYVRGDMVYDLKTTSKYEFGKYSKYWQQHVYPYALIESGKCTDITAFEFTAFAMKGGTSRTPLLFGDMYPEVYTYDHERSTNMLKGVVEQFAEFLINNRDLITDKKIFGGEKETAQTSDEKVNLLFEKEMERKKQQARNLINK